MFITANREFFAEKGKRKHVDRVIRQMERMQSVLEYDRLNVGDDLSLTAKGKPIGRRRRAHVPKTKDEHVFSKIGKVLASVSQQPPFFGFLSYGDFLIFLVTDNLK